MSLESYAFGSMPDGREVHLHTLRNSRGMKVSVTDLGACLVSVRVPDGRGGRPDVCLGFDGATGYLDNTFCMGAIVGRNANRIAGARFDLMGTTHHLAANMGQDNIHSGPHFYFERLWTLARAREDSITLNLRSRRGDQGFPGAVDVNVTYTLTDENELRIDYDAMPDDATVINLTCHAMWNLNGHAAGSVLGHTLQLEADAYTPVDERMLPTGEIAPVDGTPYDLRTPKTLAAGAEKLGGYDINYVLHNDEHLERACTLTGDRTGISMDVYTDSPGLQLYTAPTLDQGGKDGVHYGPSAGVALETQFYPDFVHHKNFPQGVYAAGHAFRFTTAFAFHAGA